MIKEKKVLFGRVHVDNYQQIVLEDNGRTAVNLTQLLNAWYAGCQVKIEIEVIKDRRLDALETRTINDI